MALLRLTVALVALVLAAAGTGRAQDVADDEPPPPERASAPPVAIAFTPPALEGEIVLGIFDARDQLVRTLRYEPDSPELRIDTNGYIVQWDGRDERGAAAAAGRYRARGYVVGEAVSVEGEAFHFNDWAAEDRIPATAAKLVVWPESLGVELATATGPRYAQIAPDGTLAVVAGPPAEAAPASRWVIVGDAAQKAVVLPGADGVAERSLRVPAGEPQPGEVVARPDNDTILLREEAPGGAQRVRMLHRQAAPASAVGNGTVADWEVVFEREWRAADRFGLLDGRLAPEGGAVPAERMVPLVPNALEPGPASVRLRFGSANPGSALFAPGKLKLIEVSTDGAWNRFVFAPGPAAGEATLFQGDGLLVEEFAVRHLEELAAFDAGEFLLTPAAQ